MWHRCQTYILCSMLCECVHAFVVNVPQDTNCPLKKLLPTVVSVDKAFLWHLQSGGLLLPGISCKFPPVTLWMIGLGE